MVTINERIREVRAYFCKGKNKIFAEHLNKQPNTTSNWCRDGYSVGNGVIQEIADTFGVSSDWLLTGRGSMLEGEKTQDEESGNELARMLKIIESQQETIDRLTRVVEGLTVGEKRDGVVRTA